MFKGYEEFTKSYTNSDCKGWSRSPNSFCIVNPLVKLSLEGKIDCSK